MGSRESGMIARCRHRFSNSLASTGNLLKRLRRFTAL
jgi:hypothetical protein